MSGILTEANKTFAAGNEMAISVNNAIRSLDEFVRSVSPSHTNQISNTTNERPFDVLDYGRAASEIGVAARDLNAMLSSLDSSTAELARLSEQATVHADRVVWHAAGLGLVLILVLLIGSVLAGLIYQIIVKRWLGGHSGPSGVSARKQPSNAPE